MTWSVDTWTSNAVSKIKLRRLIESILNYAHRFRVLRHRLVWQPQSWQECSLGTVRMPEYRLIPRVSVTKGDNVHLGGPNILYNEPISTPAYHVNTSKGIEPGKRRDVIVW
jgi:hypothetical protein